MAGKKGSNSKREAGLAKKAENAQKKAAAQAARDEAAEEVKWKQGAKSSEKKEAAVAKKADAARKKAERDALLAEEEKNTPGRSNPKNSKQATKKTRGLDLSQLDNVGSLPALNASGIDNALDALSLTDKSGNDRKIDRHPERRFPAAYAAYEERRLEEMKADGSGDGLRFEQKKQKIRKEFEKHPDNPFNQLTAAHDATKEEINEILQKHRKGIEQRLGS